jgi:cell division protein FtsQ
MASSSNRKSGSSGSSQNRRKVHVGTGSLSRKLSEQPEPQQKVDTSHRQRTARTTQPSQKVRSRSFEVEAPRSGAGDRVARGKRDDRERRIAETRRRKQLRVMAVVLVVVVVVAGSVALYRSAIFRIDEVQVLGTERLTADAVRSRAAVPDGATLLRYPSRAIRERLLAYAWIAEVQVTRDFPHTLRIRVVERSPIAAVDTGDTFWAVDKTGMVLGEQAYEETSTLPVIRDIPGLDLKAGRASTSEVLGNALAVLAGISDELRGKLRAVTAPSIDETTLLTTENVEILVGQATELETKSLRALTIMRKYAGNVVFIDVRSTERDPVWRGLAQ